MDDDDVLSRRQARAVLCAAWAVAHAPKAEDREALFQQQCKMHSSSAHQTHDELSKFGKDMQYFKASSSSSKWPTFKRALGRCFELKCQTITRPTKLRVRGLKCSLCGTEEANCMTAVQLAGHRSYQADDFSTSDLSKLADAYYIYGRQYNAHGGGNAGDLFLGTVLPGATCLGHLRRAFASQDLMRRAIDDVFQMNGETFPSDAIDALAERIDGIRSGVTVQPPTAEHDDTFWANVLAPHPLDTVSLLRTGHARLEALAEDTCEACDVDDDDQEEDDLDDVDQEEDEVDEVDQEEEVDQEPKKKRRRFIPDKDGDDDGDKPAVAQAPTRLFELMDAVKTSNRSIRAFRAAGLVSTRASTVEKLQAVATCEIERENYFLASKISFSVGTLLGILDGRKHGTTQDSATRRSTLHDIETGMAPVILGLEDQGRETALLAVAEAVLLARELLG